MLDEEEIETADARIQAKHPLATVPLSKVFPFCKPCCFCTFKEKKRKIEIFMSEECHEQTQQLEKIIKKYADKPYVGTGRDDNYFGMLERLYQATKRNDHHDEEITGDENGDHGSNPYSRLGFGFEAYFRMIWCYFLLFTLFSIMLIPTLATYKAANGFGQNSRLVSNAEYSLGNMGFSDSDCMVQYAMLPQNRTLSCAAGKFSELNFLGIIPDSFSPTYNGSAYCGPASKGHESDYSYLANITMCSEAGF